MTSVTSVHLISQVRPRPEGGGDFAPALGGGSGANRNAARSGEKVNQGAGESCHD